MKTMVEKLRLRKEKRKESIIESALTVLAREGFDGLSMRKIAKAEGISEAMLYRFYKNKYAILQTILEVNIQKITDEWKAFMETVKALVPDLKVSLPIIGKMMAKTITENHAFLRFLVRDSPKIRRIFIKLNQELGDGLQGPGLFQKAIQSVNILEVLTDYFKRCKKAGNLREDLSPEECAILVTSNLLPLIAHLPTLLFRGSKEEIDVVKLVDTQIKVMLDGMVAKKREERKSTS
ncbi:MAG: TetR/AcrR family transcriptional regulator [Candidatus Heimdallarchaeota archaeon]|nr:TetR/AcrR family transcriptional regulator [Candidatus Heimdallarchaeota archaeon]